MKKSIALFSFIKSMGVIWVSFKICFLIYLHGSGAERSINLVGDFAYVRIVICEFRKNGAVIPRQRSDRSA